MKEIKLYQCSICETQYADKTACKQCEDNHKTELVIIEGKFTAFKDNKTGWPVRIIVKDISGCIARYKLQGSEDNAIN